MGKDGNNIDPNPRSMWTHILYHHLRSAPSYHFISAVHAIQGKKESPLRRDSTESQRNKVRHVKSCTVCDAPSGGKEYSPHTILEKDEGRIGTSELR